MQKKVPLLFCSLLVASVLMAQNRKQQPPPPPPPPLVEKEAPASPAPDKGYQDFRQKNRTIENMQWSESGKRLHIQYKGGRTEVYNLQENAEGDKIVPGAKIPPPPPPVAN